MFNGVHFDAFVPNCNIRMKTGKDVLNAFTSTKGLMETFASLKGQSEGLLTLH